MAQGLFNTEILIWIGLPALALGLVVVVALVLKRRKPPVHATAELPAINVAALGQAGPPASPVQLECYGAPVRIAAIVLAPMGTGGGFPSNDQLPEVIDRVVPGLSEIGARDRPTLRRWPAQLSPQGFANNFCAGCRLPGDRGKSTPWCSVAGRYLDREVRLLIGIVLCSAAPNSLGEFTLDQPTQWMDILRIRRSGP